MARLRITRQAGDDLEEIRVYGEERFGAPATLKHLGGLRDVFALLARFPRAGQARPEYGEGIHAVSHRPHRVLYRITGDDVVIVRVVHAARDAYPVGTDEA